MIIDLAAIPWWIWLMLIVFLFGGRQGLAAFVFFSGVFLLLGGILLLVLCIFAPIGLVALIGYGIYKLIKNIL